jgi:hypothetical protein
MKTVNDVFAEMSITEKNETLEGLNALTEKWKSAWDLVRDKCDLSPEFVAIMDDYYSGNPVKVNDTNENFPVPEGWKNFASMCDGYKVDHLDGKRATAKLLRELVKTYDNPMELTR